ncbi:MAG: chromosome partitioning protein ParB [Acidobacteria bacterium]|nr:MAG: chromosome partitioning protein ParB [Acidobacteriota bacterium]
MKRKALGKGLSALLPDPEASPPDETALNVSPDRLEPNPFQPRTLLEPARLEELAASIRESGVIQPLLVRRSGPRYQIIAGERRWRAAQRLGLATVPVVVREVPDERLLELALVENIQREVLSPLEEAQAFQRLHDEFRLSQEDVARKVGRDRSTIANTLRLLRLPAEVKDMIAGGRLDAGHGRALLALERPEDQLALGREAARKGLSVREVERRAALQRAPRPRRARDPNTRAAEERLRAALGARVRIVRRGKGGALRVEFKTEPELHRLYEMLLRAGRGR